MANPLTAAGAVSEPSEYATLSMDRAMTGLWTQRSPLRDADVPYIVGKFYSASRFDSLIDGLNREITSRLTDARAPGSSVWNASTFGPVNSYFAFKYIQGAAEVIRTIADCQDGNIYDASAGGKTTVFSKSAGAGKARFVGLSGIMYIADGLDLVKYLNGAMGWGTANWQPTGSGENAFGPSIAGSGANAGGTGVAWTNPGNVASPTSYATASIAGADGTTQSVLCAAYPFAVGATEIISGIQVDIDSIAPGAGDIFKVQLLKNGTPVGYALTVRTAGAAAAALSFGGSAELWGTAWDAASVNSATFGVAVAAVAGAFGGAGVYSVRNVRVTIYGMAGPSVTPTGSGTLTTSQGGWIYVQCYGNSADQSCSTASPPSLSTGDFSNVDHVDVDVTASLDPQVNQIRVFRTVDGGPDDTLLELPNSPFPNVTATIEDAALDTQLNSFSLAPVNHEADPPPAGMVAPVYHLGRVFGISGNLVVWSAGPDVQPAGANGNSAFPPLNFAPFEEQPIRLYSGVTNQGPTLFIFGTANVYAIFGSGTQASPFLPPTIYMARVGILSYDEGEVIGSTFYMFTSTGKFVSFDPSAGYVEQGFPIGDQFAKVTTGGISQALYSPGSGFVTWHEAGSGDTAIYVADGAVGWFRLSPIASPESGYVWSPRRAIVGGTSAVQSVETSPGVFQLLIGPAASGPILYRDLTVNTDWASGAAVAYPSWDVRGNVVLCESGEIAEIAHIGLKSTAYGGTRPKVSLLLGEIAATATVPFDELEITGTDPPELEESQTLYSDRYVALQNSITPKCDNFQLKIDYGTQATADELLKFSIYGAKHAERKQQ
jgi:hypothetical protein